MSDLAQLEEELVSDMQHEGLPAFERLITGLELHREGDRLRNLSAAVDRVRRGVAPCASPSGNPEAHERWRFPGGSAPSPLEWTWFILLPS